MVKIQRPKCKMPGYGLGRRTSLIGILHKLKPYIYQRYAPYFTGEMEVKYQLEQTELSLKGQLLNGKCHATDKLISGKMNAAKNYLQAKLRHESKKCLSTLKDINAIPLAALAATAANDENINNNQINNISKKRDAYLKPEFLFPLKHYLDYKLKRFTTSNPIEPIRQCFTSMNTQMVHPTFDVALLPAHFARRIESALISNPDGLDLFNHQLHGNESNNDPDMNANMLCEDLDKTTQLRIMDTDISGTGSSGTERFVKPDYSSVSQSSTTDEKHPSVWQKSNKMLKIVLAYFVVFCVISVLMVLTL